MTDLRCVLDVLFAEREQMLQLRADLLSSNQPLTAFWARREANESGQHM